MDEAYVYESLGSSPNGKYEFKDLNWWPIGMIQLSRDITTIQRMISSNRNWWPIGSKLNSALITSVHMTSFLLAAAIHILLA